MIRFLVVGFSLWDFRKFHEVHFSFALHNHSNFLDLHTWCLNKRRCFGQCKPWSLHFCRMIPEIKLIINLHSWLYLFLSPVFCHAPDWFKYPRCVNNFYFPDSNRRSILHDFCKCFLNPKTPVTPTQVSEIQHKMNSDIRILYNTSNY